ncbi:hypothetical protein EHO57_14190 [Leptospira langatensis]|uniref:Uncharacterized protein n=1 Tax=Leptospira langatensis TaxID=2484983 RepID=A0A5R2ATA1_9LEPT|nr:hypothetical protein [Leptospira langatensis]TGJ99904.1 hypothetical protein EHO57_14190 [Leptospira langatensis]
MDETLPVGLKPGETKLLFFFTAAFGAGLGLFQKEILINVGVPHLDNLFGPVACLVFLPLYSLSLLRSLVVRKRRKDLIRFLGKRFSYYGLSVYLGVKTEEEFNSYLQAEFISMGDKWMLKIGESIAVARHIASHGWDTPVQSPVLKRMLIKERLNIQRRPKSKKRNKIRK